MELLLIVLQLFLVLCHSVLVLVVLLPTRPRRRFLRFVGAFDFVPIVKNTAHVEPSTFHVADFVFHAATLAAAPTTWKPEWHLLFKQPDVDQAGSDAIQYTCKDTTTKQALRHGRYREKEC